MKSIMQKNKECYVCHTTIGLHIHHICEGRNRNNSEKYGLWIYLCGRHHNLSNEGIHFNKELDLSIKKQAEQIWLDYYNKDIDDFISVFYINYL